MRMPLSPAIGGGRTRPHTDTLRPLPHWVYRLYNEKDELLYVGCTYRHPLVRIRALRNYNASVQRAAIHRWIADLYRNMDQALAVEGMWIDLASPPLNGMRSGVTARRITRSVGLPVDHTSGLFEIRARAVA